MNNAQPTCLLLAKDEPKTEDIARFLCNKHVQLVRNVAKDDLVCWLMSNNVDLVIIDLAILGEQSKSIFQAISDYNDTLPIIVLRSKLDDDGGVFKGLNNYADVLYKPALNLDQLYHCVKRALNVTVLRQENSQYRTQLEKANKELKEYIRLLERDQQAGRHIQSKLMPSAPVSHNGLNIDYKIIPSLYLSGDFIDYGFLGQRYFAFYLCDVSGHGAAPAFVTVWLKQIVRRFFHLEDLFATRASFEADTANLLAKLNDEFIRASLGSHLTSFVGVIDTQTLEMRYVVAGHLPLPVLCADGKAQYLQGKGKPVGIFEHSIWEVHSLDLSQYKTFTLTVFSDGVLDVLLPDNLIDKENYLLELMTNDPKDIDSICSALELSNVEHAPDDIAVLRIDNEILQ